jgi:hypothetical protein
MDWKETDERVERLAEGDYPGAADNHVGIHLKNIILDEFLMKRNPLLRLIGGSYRWLARIFVTTEKVVLYEYELRGYFGVYSIPLDEITDVSTSHEQVIITGEFGRAVKFKTNKNPKIFIDTINRARAAKSRG